MIELDKYIAETIRQILLGIQTASEDCKDLGVIVNPNIIVGHPNDYYIPSNTDCYKMERRVQSLDMEICLSVTEVDEIKAKSKIGISVLGLSINGANSGLTANSNKVKFAIPVCFPTTRINKEKQNDTK